jgi:hypothetical protein
VEEVKEMMTGEWNISDRSAIHATAAARRADPGKRWRAASPPALLWGDRPAQSLRRLRYPRRVGAATGAALIPRRSID